MLGWVFIAFAIALAVLAVTDPDGADRTDMLRAAVVPTIIGVAVLLLVRLRKAPAPG